MHPIGKKKKHWQLNEKEKFEHEIAFLKEQAAMVNERIESLKEKNKQLQMYHDFYRELRKLEVIIPDADDGMRCLTGDELDAYLKDKMSIWGDSKLHQLLNLAATSTFNLHAFPTQLLVSTKMQQQAESILYKTEGRYKNGPNP